MKAITATEGNFRSLHHLNPKTAVTAYKFVTRDRRPACYPETRPRLKYKDGATVIERNCNANRFVSCGAGLNVATKQWCRDEWPSASNALARKELVLLKVQFKVSDIVCIPEGSDGKFRVRRLRVLGPVSW